MTYYNADLIKYIKINDKVLLNHLSLPDRGNLYGDGFFETIRLFHNRLPFWSYHAARMRYSFSLLFDVDLEAHFLEELRQHLLQISSDIENARIRISFYRSASGYYSPDSNSFYLTLSVHALKVGLFTLPSKGLSIGVLKEFPRPGNHPFWNIKSCSASYYTHAAQLSKKHGWEEAILLSPDDYLVECISSSLFLVIADRLYTPKLSQGGVRGTLRACLIDHFDAIPKRLSLGALKKADSIFLTNAVKGVQWVSDVNEMNFSPGNMEEIIEKLNTLVATL